MNQDQCKRKIRQEADELRDEMAALSLDLFRDPELSGEEHRSVERLRVALMRHGFAVRVGLGGLPTAFLATRPDATPGPRIAFLAEYDALPLVGHGCGHNLIGTAGTYAGIVAAKLADSLGGSISVVGTPAEETLGGKVVLTRAGVFDDFDAAIMVHPAAEDRVHSTSLACSGLEVTFTGKAAHAVAHPEKGINALEPLIHLFLQVEEARKRWGPEVRTPGVILQGGLRANIVPETAVGQFTVRAPRIRRVHEVRAEMEEMVRRLAGRSGAEFAIRSTDEPYFEMVTNTPLAEAYRANLTELGRTAVDGPRINQGSLDMGNVSYVCPSIHPFVSICDPDLASHTVGFGEASVSPRGQSALLDSVKAMAMTAVDSLLLSPELVSEARRSFENFRAQDALPPEPAS